MLKLAVLVCLVALCTAQTPTRPNIPETFISMVTFFASYFAWLILYKRRLQCKVDLHRGASETLFGEGSINIR